ncbi:retrovirus-related pol polyprotein from transposon tnt 1-94, partial [Moniliophthora roreri MCA 2997]
ADTWASRAHNRHFGHILGILGIMGNSDSDRSQWTKLDNQTGRFYTVDFELWASLREKELLEYIDPGVSRPIGSENSKTVKAWRKKTYAAANDIIKRLDRSQIPLVRGHEENPCRMWEILTEFHTGSSLVGTGVLWDMFSSVKWEEDVELKDFMTYFLSLADQLEMKGEPPTATQITSGLLNALLEQFETLHTVLEVDPKKTDKYYIMGRVLAQQTRFSGGKAGSGWHSISDTPRTTAKAFVAQAGGKKAIDPANISCFQCSNKGHFAAKCPLPPVTTSGDSATTPTAVICLR